MMPVIEAKQLGKCVIDHVLTDEQFSKGLWLCAAPANYHIINIIYLGRVVVSLKESHTDREARAAAQHYIDKNGL